mmetsp:Transcript_144409/g.402316  ORF Transcript_144409/g.402316 Transcript_144409/m.402316 type:complete len:329 (+) Transcript_144409:63-1049(+)
MAFTSRASCSGRQAGGRAVFVCVLIGLHSSQPSAAALVKMLSWQDLAQGPLAAKAHAPEAAEAIVALPAEEKEEAGEAPARVAAAQLPAKTWPRPLGANSSHSGSLALDQERPTIAGPGSHLRHRNAVKLLQVRSHRTGFRSSSVAYLLLLVLLVLIGTVLLASFWLWKRPEAAAPRRQRLADKEEAPEGGGRLVHGRRHGSSTEPAAPAAEGKRAWPRTEAPRAAHAAALPAPGPSRTSLLIHAPSSGYVRHASQREAAPAVAEESGRVGATTVSSAGNGRQLSAVQVPASPVPYQDDEEVVHFSTVQNHHVPLTAQSLHLCQRPDY